MKLFYSLIILVLLQSCSFDNKSGIWKNDNNISKEEKDIFSEFETLFSTNNTFDKIVSVEKNFQFKLTSQVNNSKWTDIFYNQDNNYKNFTYNDNNKVIFKSKKISRSKMNNFILFNDNNIISSDHKGNIIIFSLTEKKIIKKFNFYKKRYKKIKKNLNLLVENDIIYISDNLGYLYALEYKKDKLLWAKNYKIPFKSNLKILKNNLIAANQNNNLYFINKINGNISQLIPTEETIVKNSFINNLSLNNSYSLFLNTYGSLYAIDNQTLKIKWFLNLNQTLSLNPSNLFMGNQILISKDKVIISANQYTYILDINTGSIIYKVNFSSLLKPFILNDYLFLITKNNLLVSFNLKNGKIIYSYDVNQKIAKFLNTKKKNVKFKELALVNNKIFIFLKNSYILKFNINGELEKISKLPSKLNTQPIFINNSMIYLDYKNKISVVD
jgi:outer membrane protein assembly factor BamB